MKIESIRIQNYRSFKDETVSLDNYTCLVGPNGGGKSTILSALNVFFRETENSSTDVVMLGEEDFHQKITAEPVTITVTFTELSPQAQEDFKAYYRQGKLILGAVAHYAPESKKAEVIRRGKRLIMKSFAPFFKAEGDGALVGELRTAYASIREKCSELPKIDTKIGMVSALREYEEAHSELCEEAWSSDEFYGATRGADKLAKHIQWVYVPAVKNIAAEQNEGKNTALGKLLARTVRLKLKFDEEMRMLRDSAEGQYRAILANHEADLKDLEKILGERLGEWAHPGATVTLSWHKDSVKSVDIVSPTAHAIPGEGAFAGDMTRLGHGFQRSYLLALLEVLAGVGDGGVLPRLLLGCEEPELYQHPPQARHMSAVLEQLSSRDAQVVVSTHSPAFITGKGFESVRLVRFDAANSFSICRKLTFEEVASRIAVITGERPIKPEGITAKLHQILQSGMNEIFFSKNLVLVEGLEDMAIITSWMLLTDRIIEYRRKGINLVPVNGKANLDQALAIAQGLGIPTFIIFDADGDSHADRRPRHEKENKALFGLLGDSSSGPFPKATAWGVRHVVWPDNFTLILEREVPKHAEYKQKAEQLHGQPGGLDKNVLCIGTKLQLAYEDGVRPPSLERLCESILAAAEA